jgi:hypothetical protein
LQGNVTLAPAHRRSQKGRGHEDDKQIGLGDAPLDLAEEPPTALFRVLEPVNLDAHVPKPPRDVLRDPFV